MTAFKIDKISTWKQLEQITTETKLSEFENTQKPSFIEQTSSFFTGNTATTNKVAELVKEKIAETYEINNDLQLKTIFNQLLRNAQMKQGDLVKVSNVRKILHTISNSTVIEARGTLSSSLKITLPKNILESESPSSIVSLETEQNQETQIHKTLIALFDQYFSTKDLPKDTEKLAEIYTNHLLAYLPYRKIESGSSISIPQKIDDKWELIEFVVDVLYLTPESVNGQIPAIGLTPKTNSNARPLLLFRGTPDPRDSGALMATVSDFIPGYAVGEALYEHYCKETIHNWITKAYKTYGPVNLYGLSLGGTIPLLVLCRLPEAIHQVVVFNPPAPLETSLRNYEENCSQLSKKPRVDIYWQEGDFVPKTGFGFHKEWNLHKIVSPIKQDLIQSHTDIKVTHKDVIVLKMNPTSESLSTSRKVVTAVHHTFSAILFPVSATLVSIATIATEGKKAYNDWYEYLYA